jgi:hypothetical protein
VELLARACVEVVPVIDEDHVTGIVDVSRAAASHVLASVRGLGEQRHQRRQ